MRGEVPPRVPGSIPDEPSLHLCTFICDFLLINIVNTDTVPNVLVCSERKVAKMHLSAELGVSLRLSVGNIT
jgi:hypothetical protein